MKSLDELTYYGIVHQVPILNADGIEHLKHLMTEHQVRSFLEIGTAIGRTALMAASLHPDMRVVTIERDPEMIAQAKANIASHPNGKQVLLIEGDARETEIPPGPYDMIFIDAAKGQYKRFFERYVPYLSQTGIIVSDNMDFHGMVEHPERTQNRHTKSLLKHLRQYRQWLEELEDFETVFYTAGDGMAVTRRKSHV